MLRKARNLTQVDVSRAIGITRAAYAQYEQGRREPALETLKKIAELFECPTDYLLSIGEFDVRDLPQSKWVEIGEQLLSLGIEKEVAELIAVTTKVSKRKLTMIAKVLDLIIQDEGD